MQKLERRFLKVSLISKHLYCPICTEVFDNPQRLPCGHTFCQICIKKMQASPKKKSIACPECRKIAPLLHISKDLLAQKIIDDLEVQCENKFCEWKGRLEDYYIHHQNCKIALPDWLMQKQNKFEESQSEIMRSCSMPFLEKEEIVDKCNDLIPEGTLLSRVFQKGTSAQRKALNNIYTIKNDESIQNNILKEIFNLSDCDDQINTSKTSSNQQEQNKEDNLKSIKPKQNQYTIPTQIQLNELQLTKEELLYQYKALLSEEDYKIFLQNQEMQDQLNLISNNQQSKRLMLSDVQQIALQKEQI